MAGVMAGAIFVEAQQAFGRAACMSPNWPIYDKRMIDHPQLLSLWPAYFAQLGAPAGRKLWLDHGTKMMDAGMAPHQIMIARRLASWAGAAAATLKLASTQVPATPSPKRRCKWTSCLPGCLLRRGRSPDAEQSCDGPFGALASDP